MSEALGINFEEIDRAGVVTLDRPARLNALNREMFEALSEHYRSWAPAPHIYGVVMQSSHPSVFSSGGDLKLLQEWGEQGARGAIREFYRAAYSHVWVLEKFIRPNVPLINGLVLGGGIGISLYGTHCVAGEGYRFAMPQVGIGFLPDIGGTYFLPRMLGRTGLYLASDRAPHRTRRGLPPPSRQPHHPGRAFRCDQGCLERQPSHRPAPRRPPPRPWRRRARAAHAFASTACSPPRRSRRSSRRLDEEQGEDEAFARETASEIRKKSPTSLKIAFAQYQRGKSLDLAAALRLEFRLASHLIGSHDYREGIAARIAGKGRAPDWQPATLASVDDEAIERLFTTPAEDELELEHLTPGL